MSVPHRVMWVLYDPVITLNPLWGSPAWGTELSTWYIELECMPWGGVNQRKISKGI